MIHARIDKATAEEFTQLTLISTKPIYDVMKLCHAIAVHRGWWPEQGRNFGEAIALAHSELSEALEGHRKNLPSDHLSDRSMVEEEFADVIIRLFDIAVAMELDIPKAILEKCTYNLLRVDHGANVRSAAGGKTY